MSSFCYPNDRQRGKGSTRFVNRTKNAKQLTQKPDVSEIQSQNVDYPALSDRTIERLDAERKRKSRTPHRHLKREEMKLEKDENP